MAYIRLRINSQLINSANYNYFKPSVRSVKPQV
jgi:hypothetical protein